MFSRMMSYKEGNSNTDLIDCGYKLYEICGIT